MPLFKRRLTGIARWAMRKRGTMSGALRRTRQGMFRRKGRRAMLQKYNVHAYKRYAATGLVVTNSATYANSKVFTLDETVNSSELTALYDQYQITGVKVKVRLLTNPDASALINGTTTNTNNSYPSMWYVRDYDNTSAESISDLQQRNNVKCIVLQPNKYYNFFVRPAARQQLYLDGVTTAQSPTWKQWIDCANATVPHYGFKYAFDPTSNNTNNWYIRFEYCYYLKFKNCR